MPTVLLLDRESSRRQHLVELIQSIDPGIQIEAFIKPEAALSWLSWNVADLLVAEAAAYLHDIGRSYQEVIRINIQSGKGGIAYVLERDYGYDLPRWLQIDFSSAVQAYAEERA